MGWLEYIIKPIVKRILKSDIELYEERIRTLCIERDNIESNTKEKYLSKINRLECELNKRCKVEKENEILRKYYALDKEPTDEIKMKIHIDLEINRLKEENLRLHIIKSLSDNMQPYTYTYIPYIYPPIMR